MPTSQPSERSVADTVTAACAFTLTSIIEPRWISWNSETVSSLHLPHLSHGVSLKYPLQPSGEHIHYTYGLHRRCSSLTGNCVYFPHHEDCHGDRYFCSMWRSVGFLMSLAVVIEGMTLITYIVILAGGKQKRESGWKILSGLLVLVGLIQCTSMALMVKLAPSTACD